MLKNVNALDPNVKLNDVKRAYKEGEGALNLWLSKYDPSGQAGKLFREMQEKYAAGRELHKIATIAFAKEKDTATPIFDVGAIQHYFNTKETNIARRLRGDFEQARAAVRLREGSMGVADQYTPHGLVGTAAGVLPWGNLPRHLAYPELVGHPLNLSNRARTGLDLGAGRVAPSLGVPPNPLQLFSRPGLRVSEEDKQ
jgi:hypothetical protein